MIATMTYTNATHADLTGPTDANCSYEGCVVYYDVTYDTSGNEAFSDFEAYVRYLIRLDMEELRRLARMALRPWRVPDQPMLKPCRQVNRMMRPNQIGRKTIVIY